MTLSDADERTRTLGGGLPSDPPSSTTWPTDLGDPRFAPPTAPGDIGTLGKYRIQKELGRGGMGIVYAAADTRLQRTVALKVMRPALAVDPVARERFLREARAAARITSDHVVGIFEADEFEGVAYIAMPLLAGQPLDWLLERWGPPAIPMVIRIGREAAIGLAAAHALGIVHRDIKPANLWLEAPADRVKLLDFGLAKPLSSTAELTASGTVSGTPSYMAPEQGLGRAVDGRADLFSLGCVLYRLCTGKLPFDGTTALAVLLSVAGEEPPLVEQLNPNVPPALGDLIRRLMAKELTQRPQSAAAVADEFATLERQLVREPSARRAFLDPAEQKTVHTKPSSRNRRWLFVAVGAAVALAVAVAVVLVLWNRNEVADPKPQHDPVVKGVEPPIQQPQPQPKPNPLPPAPNPPAIGPQRAAAVALLDDFDADVRSPDGFRVAMREAQVPDEMLAVRTLFVKQKAFPPGHFTQSVLPRLAALGSLEGIHDQFNELGLLSLADIDALYALPIHRTLATLHVGIEMTPKAVARLAKFPALQVVSLDARVSDGATVAAALAALPAGIRVEEIRGLGRAEGFGKDGWAAVAKAMPQGLHLQSAKVSVGFAKVIGGMAELNALTLLGVEFEAGALAEIGKNPRVSIVTLWKSNACDDDVPGILALPKLMHLNAAETRITAAGLRKLTDGKPGCTIIGFPAR